MSGEHFDSGAVLSRARPVLTFASVVDGEASMASAVSTRPRVDTPTPSGISLAEVHRHKRPATLPVISRIVRRTSVRDLFWGEPLGRVSGLLRRSGVGTLVVGALGLATLGVIAGLGMRSLSDEATNAVSAAGVQPVYDAVATERLLARAPLAPRMDQPMTMPRVEPLPVVSTRPAAAAARPQRTVVAPSHAAPRAFAAAHAAHAAAKRASSSAVARR
jgi:hypothetical protein